MDEDDYDPRDDPDFQEMDFQGEEDYSVFDEVEYDDSVNWDVGVGGYRDNMNCRVYISGGSKFYGECFSIQSMARLLAPLSYEGRLKVSISVDCAGQVRYYHVGTTLEKVILNSL